MKAVVDISNQKLRIYRLGNEIFSTSVITGKDSTPTDVEVMDV
jgi:murein L,D-transpeptidase YcbB/YkuD